jgi:hypothetical protein
MDAFMSSLAGFPWYAWVAIVAILAGAVVKIVTSKKRGGP